VRKRQVGLEASGGQAFQQGERIAAPDEDVKVLGAAHVARVVAEGVPPSDEKRDVEPDESSRARR
jgi:hypothetical protein